ncbi:hypothetical protein IV102_01985 [bacterium]|nr:hypothetical protein [bacterium]
MNPQDPTILPSETVTLGVNRSDRPSPQDYAVADAVKPRAGNVVFCGTVVGRASVSVLANLQTGFDAFLPYCCDNRCLSGIDGLKM